MRNSLYWDMSIKYVLLVLPISYIPCGTSILAVTHYAISCVTNVLLVLPLITCFFKIKT